MNFQAVKALLAPMSDEQFEASLQDTPRSEDAVTLADVGLEVVAREVVAERDATPPGA
jgi:hypothetical protein